MNFRKGIVAIFGIIVLGLGIFSLVGYFSGHADETLVFGQRDVVLPVVEEKRIPPEDAPKAIEPVKAPALQPKIWSRVPFVSQAPTGEWGKSEFQNGCEEASVLMVHAYRTGKTYAKETAKAELVAMARYQEKKIGQGIDTDAADTAEILLAGYFDITDYRLVYDFALDDLRRATADGLIIVPTNGRALGNPNFTAPGPLEHMLVVTGYDALKKEFITNDPGTRKGDGYRYPEQVLYDAIREYPTGKHLPIMTDRKAMIVVLAASNP